MGSPAWAAATGGHLTRCDQAIYAAEALVDQATSLARIPWDRTHRLSGAPATDVPDTLPARTARALAEERFSEALFNHSVRCWQWATMISDAHGWKLDHEALYVASLIHDLGLITSHAGPHHCFTLDSLDEADGVLGHLTPRARSVIEWSVLAHMNIRLPEDAPVEARALHAAAHLDVTGRRSHQVPPTCRGDILHRYPRSNFRREFTTAMRRQLRRHPTSRAATAYATGLPLAIALQGAGARVGDT